MSGRQYCNTSMSFATGASEAAVGRKSGKAYLCFYIYKVLFSACAFRLFM